MEIEITTPTPVLNTPDFHHAFGGDDGKHIPRNPFGHPLYYEFVALKGMRFHVIKKIGDIYQIRFLQYSDQELYIDSRFTGPSTGTIEKSSSFPDKKTMAQKMEKLLGTKYVWGGNWSAGIRKLLQFYPPKGKISQETKLLWTMKGVDCSGLLFEASNGMTPRNTSQLVYFGKSVPIAGRSSSEILSLLKPLDLVVWPGHVWYVLNERFSIESKAEFGGVIRRHLLERLEETCLERQGVNDWTPSLNPRAHFVIRRLDS